jgi:hypothetical protein
MIEYRMSDHIAAKGEGDHDPVPTFIMIMITTEADIVLLNTVAQVEGPRTRIGISRTMNSE